MRSLVLQLHLLSRSPVGEMLILKFCSISAIVLSLATVAQADEVKFATSSTQGCFSTSVCTATSSTSAITDLSFSGSDFGQPNGISTVNGNLDIGLGNFTLVDNKSAFLNTNFDSVITFTLPYVIDTGQSTAFNAHVFGLVLRNVAGAAWIDFNNTPQHFTFSNSQYSGSFDFTVSDAWFAVLGYGGSDTVGWTGHVTNAVQVSRTTQATVPEPSSLALLGIGVITLFASRKRRRDFISRWRSTSAATNLHS